MRHAQLIYEARNRAADPRVIAHMQIPDDVDDALLTYALREGRISARVVETPAPPPMRPPPPNEPADQAAPPRRKKKAKAKP